MTLRLWTRAALAAYGPHDLSPDAVALIEWGDLDIEICADGSTVARDGETGAEIGGPLPEHSVSAGPTCVIILWRTRAATVIVSLVAGMDPATEETEMATVVTYQLAYLTHVHVSLCTECAERGDHGRGSLGPVSHGAHSGECQGALHGDAAQRIRALRNEAGVAGDLSMVAVCERALGGDEAARMRCADVIADAAAEDE